MRIRGACMVECIPSHMAAYIAFLHKYTELTPHSDHTDLTLVSLKALLFCARSRCGVRSAIRIDG